jgi:hypothetical protein
MNSLRPLSDITIERRIDAGAVLVGPTTAFIASQ